MTAAVSVRHLFFDVCGTAYLHAGHRLSKGREVLRELLLQIQKIVPELIELLEKRYTILRAIYFNGVVGRRTLAGQLNMGERVVRSEVNFLKSQDLISISADGMSITEDGETTLDTLKGLIHEIKGLSTLEETIRNKLELEKVIIVPGDSDTDHVVLKEMGRVGAKYVRSIITDNMIIAITGGSSVAEIANNMQKLSGKSNVLVVPARGGMGRVVETQANTVAANLANKLNASYRLLHVPDVMSEETLETMLKEPGIKETINYIGHANLLIYGIGRADEMLMRRGFDSDQVNLLKQSGVAAEAFGYYFDMQGNVVKRTSTIGVKFEDVKNIDRIVAIAGGKSKAEAIMATRTYNKHSVLVMDEGAAREIMSLVKAQD